ncbi:MAG: hypothetical protein JWR38_258 [Mucilaginibacter sp.]|nr:hypothetical protein [Mucilaginibacter sp.]
MLYLSDRYKTWSSYKLNNNIWRASSNGAKILSKAKDVVFIKVTIDDDWHLYSQTVPDGGVSIQVYNPDKFGIVNL